MLTRIVNGDSRAAREVAVRECMDSYGGLVWHIARRLSRTVSDAEDATQEIFLDIWCCAGRYDPLQGSEKVFIAMIARRRLIDRIRKSRSEPPLASLDSLALEDWPVDSCAGSERCAEAVNATAALATLRAPHRQILELSLLRGLSHSAIAAQLGLPLGTVKSCMRRGLLQVRQQLEIDAPPVAAPADRPVHAALATAKCQAVHATERAHISELPASPAVSASAAASRPRSPPAASSRQREGPPATGLADAPTPP
jgi:RNA polymerase sigma-70 factor (ECF subfamily)